MNICGDGGGDNHFQLPKSEIWFEGCLCLVTTLLSCEVCDKQFEKKSGLMNHIIIIDKDWKKIKPGKILKSIQIFFSDFVKSIEINFSTDGKA